MVNGVSIIKPKAAITKQVILYHNGKRISAKNIVPITKAPITVIERTQ